VIAVVCLHPSIDRTLELAGPLEVGGLQRTSRVWERAGGKGVNLAAVVTALGGEAQVILPVAGANGAKLKQLLERQGLSSLTVAVAGETRQCQAILDGGAHPTEINESGPALDEADLTRLERLIPDAASWVVLSGSLSPGLSADSFGAWVRRLGAQFQIAVDSSGAALAVALENGASLIKPNSAELAGLGYTPQELWARYRTRVLHSRGADGLEYIGPEGRLTQSAFSIKLVSPVGAGDATLAGFLLALERGDAVPDALRLASACGAAACLESVAGVVNPDRVQSLLDLEVVHG
jgi:1-phosphofructokinase family hexose kinase